MFCCVECRIKIKTQFQNVLLTLNLLYIAFALNTTTNTACFAQNYSMSQQQACNVQTETESLKPCIIKFGTLLKTGNLDQLIQKTIVFDDQETLLPFAVSSCYYVVSYLVSKLLSCQLPVILTLIFSDNSMKIEVTLAN